MKNYEKSDWILVIVITLLLSILVFNSIEHALRLWVVKESPSEVCSCKDRICKTCGKVIE